MQAEVDGMLVAAKNAEEKAKKAMVDAARLADAENAALKGGKAAMAKLEGKIKDLEAELASTQSPLERLQRPSREPNARPRNSPLLRERIERTKTACLSWLQNSKERSRLTNSKLKRLRRLLLSTLPSSARLSKNLRRLRNVQSLLWSCKWQTESSRPYLKDVTVPLFPHSHN